MTILILHGIEGHAGNHWQKWLHDKLVKEGHTVVMPELPKSERPDRTEWFQSVRNLIKDIRKDELVIIAHSLGVTTALDVIESLDEPIKSLISVSGFHVDTGAELNSYFLREKDIDTETVKKKVDHIFVIHSDNDPYVTQAVLSALAKDLGVEAEIIPAGGHLNTDSGYTTFPRLLEILHSI